MRQGREDRSVLSFEMRWNQPPNVTVSGEECEVIHQLLPSLLKGLSRSTYFFVLLVCAFPSFVVGQKMPSNKEDAAGSHSGKWELSASDLWVGGGGTDRALR